MIGKMENEVVGSTLVSRSPSIYDAEGKEGVSERSKKKSSSLRAGAGADTPAKNPVMASYLSGKMCPLTPSQKQTDVAHLAVQKELKEKMVRISHQGAPLECKRCFFSGVLGRFG